MERHILIDTMIGIYCVKNIVNEKVYVGKSVDIEKRWKDHKNGYNNPNSSQYISYFYNALRKYGFNSFEFSVLEECTEDKLNDREIFWINKFQSNNREYGYNTTDGGDGVTGYWDRPVYQYDLDGNFIQGYKSGADARRKTRILAINLCCNGGVKSAGGYMWSYEKHDKISKCIRNYRTSKVYQYGLDGLYIASYDSILEASQITGTPYKKIIACLHSKTTPSRGGDFMWKKEFVESLPPYKKNLKHSPVVQLTVDGKVVSKYESAQIAQKATGVPNSLICKCCKGNIKTAHGYIWKYIKG